MVITDIKNTKIRVENEEHSKAIQEAAFELGYYWGKSGYEIQATNYLDMYFINDYLIGFEPSGVFNSNKQKEIWFYNGEFHDKPQDEKFDAIEMYKKSAHKLFELGYEYDIQGEKWLSKEEIEKQMEDELIKKVSDMLNTKGFGHDKLMLKCLLSHGFLDLSSVDKTGYRKGEL